MTRAVSYALFLTHDPQIGHTISLSEGLLAAFVSPPKSRANVPPLRLPSTHQSIFSFV